MTLNTLILLIQYNYIIHITYSIDVYIYIYLIYIQLTTLINISIWLGHQDLVHFSAISVGQQVFSSALIERDFRTASGALLLLMQPGGKQFIVKFADVRQEHAMMCALREMNRRWQEHAVEVCGKQVQALTYEIFCIGAQGGLIEAVQGCRTLRELRRYSGDAMLRVYEALRGEPERLDTLAAPRPTSF